jgi:hypothetical protein
LIEWYWKSRMGRVSLEGLRGKAKTQRKSQIANLKFERKSKSKAKSNAEERSAQRRRARRKSTEEEHRGRQRQRQQREINVSQYRGMEKSRTARRCLFEAPQGCSPPRRTPRRQRRKRSGISFACEAAQDDGKNRGKRRTPTRNYDVWGTQKPAERDQDGDVKVRRAEGAWKTADFHPHPNPDSKSGLYSALIVLAKERSDLKIAPFAQSQALSVQPGRVQRGQQVRLALSQVQSSNANLRGD